MCLLILTASIHVSSWLDNGGVTPIDVYSQLWPCSWSWLSIFHCLAIDYTNFWVLAIDCVAFDSLSVSLMLWMQAATIWQYGDFIKLSALQWWCTLIIWNSPIWHLTLGSRTYRSEPHLFRKTGSELIQKSHVVKTLTGRVTRQYRRDWRLIYGFCSNLPNLSNYHYPQGQKNI